MDPVVSVIMICTAGVVAAIVLYAKGQRAGRPDGTSPASPAVPPAPAAATRSPAGALLSLILAGLAIWYFAFGGLEHDAATQLQDINVKVAGDFAQQYDIAKRSGSATDACVAAGIAAAGALQAKDEGAYQRWKATEHSDCARAGVPK